MITDPHCLKDTVVAVFGGWVIIATWWPWFKGQIYETPRCKWVQLLKAVVSKRGRVLMEYDHVLERSAGCVFCLWMLFSFKWRCFILSGPFWGLGGSCYLETPGAVLSTFPTGYINPNLLWFQAGVRVVSGWWASHDLETCPDLWTHSQDRGISFWID